MMFTTRFWSSTTALLCALLSQNCQSHALSATEEEELSAIPSSVSAMRQCTSIELPAMRSLTSPSASLTDHVSSSSFLTPSANEEEALFTPAAMGNSSTASYDLPAAAMSGAPRAMSLGNTPDRASSPDGSRVCESKVEGVLRAMPGEEDSKPSAKRRYSDLTPEDDLVNKELRAGGRAKLAKAREAAKDVRLLAVKTLGEVEWKHYFGDIEPAPDLPGDIDDTLDSACPFWPDRKVRDTHLLVLLPATVDGKPFTLNLLSELIKNPRSGGHKTQYSWYDGDVQEQVDAVSPAASYWLLMTRDVLPESRNKTYADQKELVAVHASRTGLPYELPKALEAAAAILTHHVRSGERLYGDSPWTYTRCQKWILHQSKEYPAIVGGFGSSGLDVHVHYYDGTHDIGVAGFRKF
jgi:hypothetical protein